MQAIALDWYGIQPGLYKKFLCIRNYRLFVKGPSFLAGFISTTMQNNVFSSPAGVKRLLVQDFCNLRQMMEALALDCNGMPPGLDGKLHRQDRSSQLDIPALHPKGNTASIRALDSL